MLACGPAPKAVVPTVAFTRLQSSPGVALVMACTPTGPELCFNAVDDNCNGVIDEGCGVATGLLQFTIAWGDSAADVDLIVIDPAGHKAYEGNRTTPSGLHLDRDCPAEGCNGQNIENVFYEGIEPPKGKYVVDVMLSDPHGAQTPVKVRIGARVGSRTFGADLELSPGPEEKKTFSFEL